MLWQSYCFKKIHGGSKDRISLRPIVLKRTHYYHQTQLKNHLIALTVFCVDGRVVYIDFFSRL